MENTSGLRAPTSRSTARPDVHRPVHVSAEGTTTIEYASTDVKGNTEATKTATVRIDDTAPVTTSNATRLHRDRHDHPLRL